VARVTLATLVTPARLETPEIRVPMVMAVREALRAQQATPVPLVMRVIPATMAQVAQAERLAWQVTPEQPRQ